MFKTIRGKITVCFSLAILFLFLLFGVTGYRVLSNYLVETQQQNQERLSRSLCSSIQFFRETCEGEAAALLEDKELGRLAGKISSSEERREIERWLEDYVKTHRTFRNVYLINQSYLITGTGEPKKVRTYLIDRISTAERYEGGMVWDSGYDTGSMMLFGKCSYGPEFQGNVYLFLQIDNSQITELFNQFRLQNSQRFSLKGVTSGFEVTEQGFFYKYYDNYQELLHTEITMGDWYLRTWSDKSLILGPTRELARKMLSVLIPALFMAVFLSLWLAGRITKPIMQMTETMERYGQGDFSAKVDVRGNDEIGSLGRLLNQMSEQISELFERVKKEEEQSRKLELQTMVYQINPHFLYNTLDSVNVMARRNQDYKVAELVTDLSRLFRLGLHQGREAVSVRDELMHVIYYLKIQKVRFDEQLIWELHAASELMDYEITKFILQPVVENAIYHGVKSRDEQGYLCVSVTEADEFLIFEVSDTGNGMDREVLLKLNERIRAKQMDLTGEKGYGLWNVNQRIKLCYGDACGIDVDSTPGVGTRVTIRVLKKIPA